MSAPRGASGLSGVLAIDKPQGMTSHDVVATVRRATGERRVGHAGTLDPSATGLLIVLVGPATRLERYVSGRDKRYQARIAFGSATDTLDSDGEVVGTADVPDAALEPAAARAVITALLGPSLQTPPAYSAIKTRGVPAYRQARAGTPPDLSPRPIVVYEASLESIDAEVLAWNVTFHVSKGTYIRSLARDIGTAVGTVAHLAALRRTAIGDLAVERALSLDDVERLSAEGTLATRFIDPVPLLDMPVRTVAPSATTDGRPLAIGPDAAADGTAVALVTAERLLAVYRVGSGTLRAETVLAGGVAR